MSFSYSGFLGEELRLEIRHSVAVGLFFLAHG
ncbi:hypothetical protein X737_35350 [Mesorhizobium sp. L48C026A00]|nr:hypothetical protein X737_35350 [Mesorhizobium sp. L48C026A00]